METAAAPPRAGSIEPASPRLAESSIPRIADRVVARPRVTAVLRDLLQHHSPVHVVAAAGAGKTTAVAQAVETLERNSVWVSLEEWHRSPGRLVDELLAVVEEAVPGVSRDAARARARGADSSEVARVVGRAADVRSVVVVVDDCHIVHGARDSIAVLSGLAKAGRSLTLVLVGRTVLDVPGLGVGSLDPGAVVGDELLRATEEEASAILRLRSDHLDVGTALERTGGWVAGLLFESWRAGDGEVPETDRLARYLELEVLPRLDPHSVRALVTGSLLGSIEARWAEPLGIADGRSWLEELRQAGVPAAWAPDGSAMRPHPRVREALLDTLRAGPRRQRRAAEATAARILEQEGRRERALELYLAAGEVADIQRLLPEVIVGVVHRGDIERTESYLAAAELDPEPAKVVLARVILSSLHASARMLCDTIDRIDPGGRLAEIIAEEPMIGSFAVHALVAEGRLAEASAVHSGMPPGRPADIARLALSLARDDASAPIPVFTGDPLDASLARLLYSRGRLGELTAGTSDWALLTATQGMSAPGTGERARISASEFGSALARFAHAVEMRDLGTAEAVVAELRETGGRGIWQSICEAELAVRLTRDPARARAAVGRLRGDAPMDIAFYREVADTWAGAALLLGGAPDSAAETLREAIASMRRGDRLLCAPTALVYLAEAEWQLGNEDASDRASEDAYQTAHRTGSLRSLLLSFADLPGVLSRRIDAEPAGESLWHSLGRSLTSNRVGATRTSVVPAAVHLREFGQPAVVVAGHEARRPKIRKSIELFSYLLSTPAGRALRSDVLHALWDGRDDESTRAYLRQALRHLREVLPESTAVAADGDWLAVKGAATSELLELDALLSEAARTPPGERLAILSELLVLLDRGEFLPGGNPVGWVDDQRARIDGIATDARLDLAELLVGQDRYVEALTLLETVLQSNRVSERGWRLSMQVHSMLGNDDGVLAAYTECRAHLAEIGLEPARATVELARRLRR
jgi:DNA-binding SARP family transcriptional activator